MPPTGTWNGDLLVFAHGYVAPGLPPYAPPTIPDSQLTLPDGTYLPDVVNGLGFAFAITSFSKNGLAIKEGLADVLDLVDIFKTAHPETQRVLIAGASEGGLIAVKAIEEHPEKFAGALAACGPIGDFQAQINHLGDVRVAFDYFFPLVLPGPAWSQSNITIPDGLLTGWDGTYRQKVLKALRARPLATAQLVSVTKLAFGLDPASIGDAVTSTLSYNIEGTNEALDETHGNPFDNQGRRYSGSLFDGLLNNRVKRFSEDFLAANEIATHYQTSGTLSKPLITLHTISDPVVPYWHETLYGQKAAQSGSSNHLIQIPVLRYGHCNFKGPEIVGSFALLSALAH